MAITHKRSDDLERRFAQFATISDHEQVKNKQNEDKDKKDKETI